MSTDHDTQVRQLAAEMEEDIRSRGLVYGDRYYTTAEASRMLRARRATVNDAMRLLEERELLVRRRRVGAVVGPRMGRRQTREIRLVKLVLPVERIGTGLPLDVWVHGIHCSMPGIDIQFCFVPSSDPIAYIKSTVDNATRVRANVGFILASCPREIHRVINECGFPVVVAGSVYPELGNFPSVDVDNHHSGVLVSDIIVQQGHQRIAFLANEHWTPGDNQLLDGINSRLGKSGFRSDMFRVRCLPSDREVIEAETRHMLQALEAPTAIIARNSVYAEAAVQVARELGKRIPDDVLIVSSSGTFEKSGVATFPYIQRDANYLEVVEMVGDLMVRQFKHENLEERHVRVGVKLVDIGMKH